MNDSRLSYYSRDVWEQELQREGDNPTYLRFLRNSLKALEERRGLVCIDKSTYQEWCLQADPKKFHKFKGYVMSKQGVKSRVICKDWVFSEKATSKVILPMDVFQACRRVPMSMFGAAIIAIRSRTDLTEEQKEEQVQEVFDKEIEANQAGNHYRNHYIRARNPYGHD